MAISAQDAVITFDGVTLPEVVDYTISTKIADVCLLAELYRSQGYAAGDIPELYDGTVEVRSLSNSNSFQPLRLYKSARLLIKHGSGLDSTDYPPGTTPPEGGIPFGVWTRVLDCYAVITNIKITGSRGDVIRYTTTFSMSGKARIT